MNSNIRNLAAIATKAAADLHSAVEGIVAPLAPEAVRDLTTSLECAIETIAYAQDAARALASPPVSIATPRPAANLN